VFGAVFVFVNGWLDLLDGALAREQGVDSKGGDLLDHVLDRYADIAVIAGLAAGIGQYLLGLAAVTGVLMTSYLGTQIQAVGLGREYGGLLGRADRLALIGIAGVAAAVVPGPLVVGLGVVGLLLVLFAVVGHFTALQRFWGAWSDLD
jgi:archaetidylinositol phosphate synthase